MLSKKIIILLSQIAFLAFLPQIAVSQNIDQFGTTVCQVPHLIEITKFKNVEYNAYNEPLIPERIDGRKFQKSHLKSPHSVVQSYLYADSQEWLENICEDSVIQGISEKQLKLKEYLLKNDLVFEIISEVSFEHDEKSYHICLARYEYDKRATTMFPFLLVKNTDGWKLSAHKELVEMAMFLFLKPDFFKLVLRSSYRGIPSKDIQGFINEYVYATSNLRVDKGIGLQLLMSHFSRSDKFGDILILDKKKPVKEKVNIRKTSSGFLGIAKAWNKNGSYYNYGEGLHRIMKQMFNGNIYQESPEYALASWMFSSDRAEREKNSIGYENIIDQEKLYPFPVGAIQFHDKYTFDTGANLYALIYFNHLTGYKDEKGFTREKNLGKKRMLLKWDNNQWVLDFEPSTVIRQFTWVLDQFNSEHLGNIFSRNITNPEHRQFLRDIGFYDKGRELNVDYLYKLFDFNRSRMPHDLIIKRGVQNKYPNGFK